MAEVVLFLPDLRVGGAERVVLNLLSNWSPQLRAKWAPTLVLGRTGGGLYDHVPSWVEVISLNLPRAGPWDFLATLWRFGSLMRRRRPLAIVAFHTANFTSVVLASRLASPGTKIAVSVNNLTSNVWSGNIARRSLIKFACTLSDYFLAVTPTIAEEMNSKSGIPKRKIAVLPSSVDVDMVLASRNTPVTHPAFGREEVPVIITAGRLSPQKRLDVLLEAASLLKSRTEFNLVILGEGALKADLERLALTLGLKDRTFFLGFVPNPWPYISSASVFALASDYEGLPCVLIEAMACGVPVVATQAAAEYVISNEESGLLIPQRDPEALAEGLWRLLVDRELRQRCIQGGLKRASDFRADTVMQSFCVAMENLVGEKSR